MSIEKGKSLLRSDFPTGIGEIRAVAPATSIRFTIFEPTTFPMAMPFIPFNAEVRLTASSGRLVPNATIVSPITMEGIWKILAIPELPSTKKSAPFTRSKKPINKIAI